MSNRKYRYRRHCNCNHEDDSSFGCLVMVVIGFIALPFVGLYLLLAGKDDGEKALGLVLLVIGIILWIMAYAQ